MGEKLIDYRANLQKNSDVFLFNFKEEFAAFGEIVDCIDRFLSVISTHHTVEGKSILDFVPFLAYIERQYLSSFQAFATYQSYQGWVALRPAIESALIMGKWRDDKKNSEIWLEHESNWKAYNSVYMGRSLVSESLPDSAMIQGALKLLNDRYLHVNPSYYSRHLGSRSLPQGDFYIEVLLTDPQDDLELGLYCYLHLTIFILHKLGLMFQPLFEKKEPFDVPLEKFFKVLGPKAARLSQRSTESATELKKLGLWPDGVLRSARQPS